MTPDELLKKLFEIEENYGTYLAYRDSINIIKQAKEEWEAEAYKKGFKDACDQTEEYLNEPI